MDRSGVTWSPIILSKDVPWLLGALPARNLFVNRTKGKCLASRP